MNVYYSPIKFITLKPRVNTCIHYYIKLNKTILLCSTEIKQTTKFEKIANK